MATDDIRLRVDDDPDFDDSDLYDNDHDTETKQDPQETIVGESQSMGGGNKEHSDQDSAHGSTSLAGALPHLSNTDAAARTKSDSAEQHAPSQSNERNGAGSEMMVDSALSSGVEQPSVTEAHERDEQQRGLPGQASENIAQEMAVQHLHSTSQKDPLLFDREFLEAARANRGDPEAEFEEDSNPAVSDNTSDSSDSDSNDSSSDDDSEDGSMILDPAEAARILMRASTPEDGGATSGPPRTLNEQQEKPLDIPIIPTLGEMSIVELGQVSHIIKQNNCIVIKATVHARHNVLQPGSALCLANRTLIRPISDTIAQVQDPYYVSYFESMDEMAHFGIQEGIKVFYPDHPDHRTFVFYEELRKQKFTDASNINDEEVDERELEFSDDEQEAAYKKAKKEEKQRKWVDRQQDDGESMVVEEQRHSQTGRRKGRGGAGARARGGLRGRGRGGRGGWQDYDGGRAPDVSSLPSTANRTADALDYGDDGSDGYYKKLQRPDDYGTWQNTPRPDLQPQHHSGNSLRGSDYPAHRGGGNGNFYGRNYEREAALSHESRASEPTQIPGAQLQALLSSMTNSQYTMPPMYTRTGSAFPFSNVNGGSFGTYSNPNPNQNPNQNQYQNQYGAYNAQQNGNPTGWYAQTHPQQPNSQYGPGTGQPGGSFSGFQGGSGGFQGSDGHGAGS